MKSVRIEPEQVLKLVIVEIKPLFRLGFLTVCLTFVLGVPVGISNLINIIKTELVISLPIPAPKLPAYSNPFFSSSVNGIIAYQSAQGKYLERIPYSSLFFTPDIQFIS